MELRDCVFLFRDYVSSKKMPKYAVFFATIADIFSTITVVPVCVRCITSVVYDLTHVKKQKTDKEQSTLKDPSLDLVERQVVTNNPTITDDEIKRSGLLDGYMSKIQNRSKGGTQKEEQYVCLNGSDETPIDWFQGRDEEVLAKIVAHLNAGRIKNVY